MNTWQAVAESARGRGKTRSVKPSVVAASLMLVGSGSVWAAGGLPTGGTIAAGTGSINQSGSTMTINQSSSKLAIDWQGFSVGKGSTVNFVQPGASAVALNRVLGSDVSVIQGAVNANGQVFLINPNGVLFSPTAQVNVGSLVASTLKMSTADFMAGNYRFEGASSNAVVNQGNITAVGDGSKGGSVALIAAKVSNEGSVTAQGGNVLLAAGSSVTLDLGGAVKLLVDKGALDALVENGGAIHADGGLVYLTAKAVNELTRATINNTGAIRAQTLATGEKGEIRLIADMQSGVLNAGGNLDASAPKGGDGGLIETSGAHVNTLSGLAITAGAAAGKGGEWLVDPYDYTIASAEATTIANSLNTGTSVTISTQASGGISGYVAPSGSGDITVNSAITKSAGGDATLTLRADRNILVSQNITSTHGALNLTLSAANNASSAFGGVAIAAGKTLDSNGGHIYIGGAGGDAAAAQAVYHGIGYARNFSASQEAVLIGSGARVLSRGGDITINGYSTQAKSGSNDTTGVHVGASAVIDSGYYAPGATDAQSGGFINIAGKYVGGVGGTANTVFGVKIDNPSGNSGQTTLSASTTTGSIRIEGSSTYDVAGAYALNMATSGLAGNIYFNAYSVADLIFILNGGLKGVTFTYSGPNSGCRTGYPNCGLLSVNASANNSYLYATYNAVNMSTTPIYVSATLSGTKTYDGTLNASNLNFSNVNVFDPNGSGYSSANVTAASYVTPGANVGAYTNLSASSLSRNYTANGKTYVLGYNFTVSPSYTITPATAYLSAVKTYDTTASFASSTITAAGVNGETLSLAGAGPATASSAEVLDNGTNYLTALGGLALANGASGKQGLASNYQLPSLSARSAYNIATINQAGVAVVGVGGSKYYDGTTTFTAAQLAMESSVVGSDDVALTGSADVASKNAGTYNQWTSSTLSLTGSKASNYTLLGGSINAVINPAPLGVALNAVYNGTTSFFSASGATNATPATLATGGTLTVTGLVGGEKLTGVTVSDSNVDVVTANKYVSGVVGSNGFVASNYALYNGGVPTRNVSLGGGGAITVNNNTASIAPAPLGISAAPTYNGTAAFTTVDGVADGNSGSVATGGSVSVAGLVNGQTLSGFALDNPDVASASKVTGVSITGGIDPRNYVINGNAFGAGLPVAAGAAANGSTATNVAAMTAAPLGITVGGTYSGGTSVTPATFSTFGLLGNDTITALSGATVSSANVSANGANFVKTVTVGAGTANLANYAITQAYNGAVDANGNASAGTTNVATLSRAPLNVSLAATYSGSTTVTPGATSTYAGWVGTDNTTPPVVTSALLADANVTAASNYVKRLDSAGGTVASALAGGVTMTSVAGGNYYLNGLANGAGGLAGNGLTNLAALSPALLGVTVSGTYSGGTSVTPATFSTFGLLGSDTITALSGATVNSANVAANGANFVKTVTVGAGTANLANYAITQAYNGAVDANGNASAGTTNVATLSRAPLNVSLAATYSGSTTVTPGATSSYTGWVGTDNTTPPVVTSALLADANVTAASNYVRRLDSAGGTVASALAGGVTLTSVAGGNYYLNGLANGAGGLAGNGLTNLAVLSPALLGITVGGTYSGGTSVSPTTFSTFGLLGSDTITALSGATVNSANVAANGANFVKTVTVGTGTANLANYAITQAYNGAVDANGNATAGTTNVATLSRAPLNVSLAATYSGSTTVTPGATSSYTGWVGTDNTTPPVVTSALLADANVTAASNYVRRLDSAGGTVASALAGGVTMTSVSGGNYYLNGLANGAGGLVGNGLTNLAALSPALLGVTVSGTYSGGTSVTPTTFSTFGLLGSDTITALSGATVSSANVSANGANFVKTVTVGAGTANLANYAITQAYNAAVDANGNATAGTTNVATLSRAPLNVSLAATYSGSTTVTPGATSSYSGWVGTDNTTPPVVTSALLADANVTAAGNYVRRLDSAGGTVASALAGGVTMTSVAGGNYYLNGSQQANASVGHPQNIAVLLGRAITVVADDQQKVFAATDPSLSYRITSGSLLAGDSLGSLTRVAGENPGNYTILATALTNSNYVITAIDGKLNIVAPTEPPPPPAPIIVPAFIDNGAPVLGSSVLPTTFGALNYVPTSASSNGQASAGGNAQAGAPAGGRSGAAGAPGEQSPTARSALNFVAADSTEGTPASGTAPRDAGSEQVNAPRSALNYVASAPAGDEPAPGTDTALVGGTAPKRKAAQELNVNNVTVPSSSGPLDVFVVESGINVGPTATIKSLNNQ